MGISDEQMFYYPIDLHYSQTLLYYTTFNRFVLLPYRFTLLSNLKLQMQNIGSEKMPYENI